MKVLFVASECVPFSKTGGLADVVGALPKELKKKDVDVRVITPLYSAIPYEWRSKMEHVLYFYVNLGWRRQYVGIEKLELNNITYYFVDNEYYFGRPYIYGLGGDEGERFAFFCRAVLEALPQIKFVPDVLHLNDWQTGLIPAMLEIQYRVLPEYKKVKTVYTVHNLQYQGLFPINEIEDLVSLGNLAYTADHLEFYGQCNFMKGGLTWSHKLSTVSPTYAKEIQTAYYGERLDGLLRSRKDDLVGILNGIDEDEYNPETDPLIVQNYSVDSLDKKHLNKLALQAELGLEVGADIPMIGMVGRLSGQKGLDLVERVLDSIMATGAQLVVLGMGEDKYVDLFSWAQWKYQGKLAARIEMNHALAHKIYASSDMFLMPSMFEPCGLSQMISMRYGTLPITRETGGLRDTVLSYNKFIDDGNGFTFLNYNAHDMLAVIERAVGYYRDNKEIWHALMQRDMRGHYGWDQSAEHYLDLYKAAMAPAKKAAKAESVSLAEVPVEAPKKTRAQKDTVPAAEAPIEAPKPEKTHTKKATEPAPEAPTEAPKPKKTRTKKATEPATEAPIEAPIEAPKPKKARAKKAE